MSGASPWRVDVVAAPGNESVAAPAAPAAPARLPRVVRDVGATDVRSSVVGLEARGWSRSDESGLFRCVLGAATTIDARVTAFASAGSGSEVLAALGAAERGPLGAPRVEPLPDEFGEGAIVQHAVVAADGALGVAIDMVVERGTSTVVVSSEVFEPQWVDAAAVALLRLLLAVRVDA